MRKPKLQKSDILVTPVHRNGAVYEMFKWCRSRMRTCKKFSCKNDEKKNKLPRILCCLSLPLPLMPFITLCAATLKLIIWKSCVKAGRHNTFIQGVRSVLNNSREYISPSKTLNNSGFPILWLQMGPFLLFFKWSRSMSTKSRVTFIQNDARLSLCRWVLTKNRSRFLSNPTK